MESLHQEQVCSAASYSLLAHLCANSSIRKIADESFPYVSGILDDTMDPSIISNRPVGTTDPSEQVQLKELTKTQDEIIFVDGSQTKAAFKSWIDSPITLDKVSGLNLSTSVSSEIIGSNNFTFEKSEELQGKSSAPSCTISNDDASLEDKHLSEKHLNLTVDLCSPSNTSTELPNQKLDGNLDITQSNEPKQEQSNEDQMCTKGHEKQSIFIKVAEETIAVDLTAGVPTEVAVSVEPVDQTVNNYSATTDLTPPERLPDVKKNTVGLIKSAELPEQSTDNCGEILKDTAVSGPSAPGNIAEPVKVDVTVCLGRTQNLPVTDCKEEQQDPYRRRNEISDGDGYLNLNISQSTIFSPDEMLDFKPFPLCASTPVILERGFDRVGSAKPTNIKKRLSVINSINTCSSKGMDGVSDASKTNQLSVKSDTSDQIQNVSANRASNSATSEAVIVNKAPLKLVVRRKIPQPSCKSSAPKSLLLPRPSTLQLPSAAARSKTASATQALNQPGTSSAALHSMRRTVQINKGRPLSSAKNTSTASMVKCSLVAHSTSAGNLTSEKRAGNSNTQLPKPSGLQPPGRRRFGLKPPGSAVSSEETGHSQTNNKPTRLSGIKTRNSLLPGFSQKHASSDALSYEKRKKTDLQNQASCAEAPAASEAGRVQSNVTACTNITSKRPSTVCGNCLLLKEKLNTFHEELGGFHQELSRLPEDFCMTSVWGLLQLKLESYLQEVKRLQTDHHQG